jgi:hypothetical protein
MARKPGCPRRARSRRHARLDDARSSQTTPHSTASHTHAWYQKLGPHRSPRAPQPSDSTKPRLDLMTSFPPRPPERDVDHPQRGNAAPTVPGSPSIPVLPAPIPARSQPVPITANSSSDMIARQYDHPAQRHPAEPCQDATRAAPHILCTPGHNVAPQLPTKRQNDAGDAPDRPR